MIHDLTGLKFSKLTVVKYAGQNKHKHNIWLCLCECGKETIGSTGDIRRGHKQSCGCFFNSIIKRGANKKAPGESACHQAYLQYKHKSIRRNIQFELSFEKYKELSSQCCYYCNALPNNKAYTRSKNGFYINNGIDRVDNSKGYIYNNVVPCCKTCNFNKADISVEMVEKIYEFIRKTKTENH